MRIIFNNRIKKKIDSKRNQILKGKEKKKEINWISKKIKKKKEKEEKKRKLPS